MKGKNRSIWTNAQINLMFENNVIGHLRGSYDGDFHQDHLVLKI